MTNYAEENVIVISSDSEDENLGLFGGVSSTVPVNDGIQSDANATNASQPSTSAMIECINVDDDPPSSSTPTVNPTKTMKEEIQNVLKTFVYSLKKNMTPQKQRNAKDQLWNAFRKIVFENLQDTTEIKAFIDKVIVNQSRETPKSSLRKLLTFMNSRRQGQGGKMSQRKPKDETPEEAAKRTNYEYVLRVEKRLTKIGKEIEYYGQQDVDFSEEKNSSYLIRARTINKYVENWKFICQRMDCNSNTGRSIEKRFTLKGITKSAEVSEAVENFMNNKSAHFSPDYHDIEKVVSDLNSQTFPPPLCDSQIKSTAKELFTEVMRIISSRRRQDMEIYRLMESVTDDPAENDKELRKKLEENDKFGKSERDVIERFFKQQEESKGDAKEVEEEPESSASESDDEEEEYLTADQGSGTGTDETIQNDRQFTRDQVAEESDSDSESHQPPPKKQRCSS